MKARKHAMVIDQRPDADVVEGWATALAAEHLERSRSADAERTASVQALAALRARVTAEAAGWLDQFAEAVGGVAEQMNHTLGPVIETFRHDNGGAGLRTRDGFAFVSIVPDFSHPNDVAPGLRVFERAHQRETAMSYRFAQDAAGDLVLNIHGQHVDAETAVQMLVAPWCAQALGES